MKGIKLLPAKCKINNINRLSKIIDRYNITSIYRCKYDFEINDVIYHYYMSAKNLPLTVLDKNNDEKIIGYQIGQFTNNTLFFKPPYNSIYKDLDLFKNNNKDFKVILMRYTYRKRIYDDMNDLGFIKKFFIGEEEAMYRFLLIDNDNNICCIEDLISDKEEIKSFKDNNNHISWDEYFMGIAKLSASRSKDPVTKVGACIINDDKKILSTGYNGFPNGCSDDEYPWDKGPDKDELDTKYPYVVHAELNAILNANKDIRGSTLYVTLFPCNECAKAIIQSGIKKVIYLDEKGKDKKEYIASRRMLDSAGVIYEKYK